MKAFLENEPPRARLRKPTTGLLPVATFYLWPLEGLFLPKRDYPLLEPASKIGLSTIGDLIFATRKISDISPHFQKCGINDPIPPFSQKQGINRPIPSFSQKQGIDTLPHVFSKLPHVKRMECRRVYHKKKNGYHSSRLPTKARIHE